ncbi:MAG TPA: carboxypeptidase-like regulatory domain-containing protein [Gemmatales bacterium]|nr:carboxypeptidase-like regulatory domain-containing protein [Gemmatales bacterium]
MSSQVKVLISLALLLWSGPSFLSAQERLTGPKLAFGTDSDAERASAEMKSFDLRPNVKLPFYVFIKNSEIDPRTMVLTITCLQMQEPTKQAESKKLTIEDLKIPGKGKNDLKDKILAVPFPKLDDKGINLGLAQQLIFKLEDSERRVKLDEKTIQLNVMKTEEYLSFDPSPEINSKGQLVVSVKPTAKFRGPPCQLELDWSRLKNLVPDQSPSGAMKGEVDDQENKKATLSINKLRFNKDSSDHGFFSIKVDDVARARTWLATDMESTARLDTLPANTLRIVTEKYFLSDAKDKLMVCFEVDNPSDPGNTKLDFGRDLSETGKFVEYHRPHYRNESVSLQTDEKEKNALFLKPNVSDWKLEISSEGLAGTALFRASLITPNDRFDKETKTIFSKAVAKIDPITIRDSKNQVKEPQATFLPGEMINIEVKARCPETEITEVMVYAGEAVPVRADNNKLYDTTKLIRATFNNGAWSAGVEVPDKKGSYKLFAIAWNGVGLPSTERRELKVVDPVPVTDKEKLGSIKGRVVGGTDEVSQKEVPVTLEDNNKKVIKSTKTDDKGAFEFKDVPAGSYLIQCKRGTGIATVKDKVDVTVENGKETILKKPLNLHR